MYSLNKINSPLIAILLSIVAIITIGISYSFINKENNRSSDFNSNLENINYLSKLNTKWVSSVEETKSFALKDFDNIAIYTKKIRATLADLDSAGLLEQEKVSEETVDQYKIFKNSFELKYEAIERYKSEQAILRNSVNFLQASTNDALANIRSASLKEKIIQHAFTLSTYLLLNKKELEKEAKNHLNFIESYDIENESTLGKEAIGTFISHTKVILEYNPKVNRMLEAANNVDIEMLAENVSSSYMSFQESRNNELNNWRKVLLAGIAGMLLAFILFLSRLRRNMRKEKIAEEKLKVAHTQIDKVSNDIQDSESIGGQAQLALATLHTIQKNTTPIEGNIDILKNLISSKSPTTTKEEISTLISDLEYQKNEIDLLREAIISNKTKNLTSFDVNKLLRKAIVTVKSELDLSLNFKTIFGNDLIVTNNPIAIFQILIKLLRLSTNTVTNRNVELDIHIQTWADEDYITLFMTLKNHNNLDEIYSGKGMTIVEDLIDQNNLIINIKTRTDEDGTITLQIPKIPVLEPA